jgi:hypothetical protein
MTRDEFISAYKKLRKQSTIVAVLYLVTCACIVLAAILLAMFMEKNDARHWASIIVAVYIFILLATFPALIWLPKHTIKKYGLFCPHCKKPLVRMFIEIAMATGHCGNCRQRVFEE